MVRQYRGTFSDTLPLTMFYTQAICLDLSHTGLLELIDPADPERAPSEADLDIRQADTVLRRLLRRFGVDRLLRLNRTGPD